MLDPSLCMPDQFVYLSEVEASILQDVRYYGSNNFMGQPVQGYSSPVLLMTRACALALQCVQKDLSLFGLGLKVFDAYRPQQAVEHFFAWSQDEQDLKMKEVYYPTFDKPMLFEKGYIMRHSGHTRGSTVDLTIVSLENQEELDMGTIFDFLGPESHLDYPHLPACIRAHRALLRTVMANHGFQGVPTEWWHFNLENEPFPDTYFDFPVR